MSAKSRHQLVSPPRGKVRFGGGGGVVGDPRLAVPFSGPLRSPFIPFLAYRSFPSVRCVIHFSVVFYRFLFMCAYPSLLVLSLMQCLIYFLLSVFMSFCTLVSLIYVIYVLSCVCVAFVQAFFVSLAVDSPVDRVTRLARAGGLPSPVPHPPPAFPQQSMSAS